MTASERAPNGAICALLLILGTAANGCSKEAPAPAMSTGSFTIPSSSFGAGAAPMTGIVLWSDNGALDTYSQAIALEFKYFRYDDVATGSAASGYAYDWTPVLSFLSKAASRGHHGIIRFRDTDPFFGSAGMPAGPGLPNSLRANTRTANYTEGIPGVPPRTVIFPDWSNPELANFVVDFYTHLAAAIGSNPALAYVQVGFGLFGEYHLDFSNLSDFSDGTISSVETALGKMFPSKSDQFKILSAVGAQLRNTPWSISIDAGDSLYSDFANAPQWMSLPFGLFDDSFLSASGNADKWSIFAKAPGTLNGGEISYYTASDQQNALTSAGPNGVSLKDAARMRSLTYLIGNDQPAYRSPAEIATASLALGYHYQVIEASADGRVTRVTLKNTGVAGAFFDIYPTMGAVASTTSLRGLGSGQQQTYEIAGLGAGKDFSLTSPRLLPGQRIPFEGNQ
jgi:hypothetical protein